MLLPKRGFYHPVAILVLAAITLSFAIIFYLNSSVFFKAPEKSPQPEITSSPSPTSQKSSADETEVGKKYINAEHKISFEYPNKWKRMDEEETARIAKFIPSNYTDDDYLTKGLVADLIVYQNPENLSLKQLNDKLNSERIDGGVSQLYSPNDKGIVYGVNKFIKHDYCDTDSDIKCVTFIISANNRVFTFRFFDESTNDLESINKILSTFKVLD